MTCVARSTKVSAGVALSAALVICLGCAHPPPQTANPAAIAGKPVAPLEAINGDWVLTDSSWLRVSNGGAFSRLAPTMGSRLALTSYRIAGARGPIVDLEVTEDATSSRHRKPDLPFTRRARFLVVSDSVGLVTLPKSAPSLAFRPGVLPPHLLGRYTLASAANGINVLDVGPRTVNFGFAEGGHPSTVSVAGSERSDAATSILLVGGPLKGLLRVWILANGKTSIEIENDRGNAGTVEARFEPAAIMPATTGSGDKAVVPLPQGAYESEGLGHLLSGHIEIHGAQWKVASVEEKTEFTATTVGPMGARLAHVHLDRGPAHPIVHLDLRPIDDGSGAMVVTASGTEPERHSPRTGLVFRAGVVPAWAPSFGLDKDIELLCTELATLGVPASLKAIDKAFARIGERATSDAMRSVCTTALEVDASMRITMVKYMLADLGRSLPTCAGIDRLRNVEPYRPGQAQDEETP